MSVVVRTFVTLLATFVAPGVVYAWATSVFPWFSNPPHRKRALAATLILIVAVDRVCDVMQIHWHSHGAGVLHSWLVLLLATFILATVPIAVQHGVLRALTGKRPGEPSIAHMARQAPAVHPTSPMTRRQIAEAAGGLVFFGATGSMLGWGMVRGRHAFELSELPLRIPGLPRALDGYVIVQVSDLHVGAFVGDRELDEGLALVRAARPDLIVVTGDLVDFDPRYAPLAARKLADLQARDGVSAILGNHDYYAGADAVIATLMSAGIDVLRNSGKRIRAADGGGFGLLGVDDLSSARHGRSGPDLEAALATVPGDLACILLSHQPSTVDAWAGAVAAQLSGHTHGGQINPGFSPLGLFMKYVAGPYSVKGTTLYVNRGFGTVAAPSRVGAPPEVTRIVLVSA